MEASERAVFKTHYDRPDSDWGGQSGPGSWPYWNIEYRAFLERFIRLNDIRSIVDIGCGDWQFSRLIDFSGVRYHGFDVVESVIDRNTRLHGSPSVSFAVMPDRFEDLPQADLLVMKDVLQHLPDGAIMRHRDDLFPRYPRCLVSNSYRKHGMLQNHDIEAGAFRCLDLNADPYNFSGTYVLEFSTIVFEQIRTMLLVSPASSRGLPVAS